MVNWLRMNETSHRAKGCENTGITKKKLSLQYIHHTVSCNALWVLWHQRLTVAAIEAHVFFFCFLKPG